MIKVKDGFELNYFAILKGTRVLPVHPGVALPLHRAMTEEIKKSRKLIITKKDIVKKSVEHATPIATPGFSCELVHWYQTRRRLPAHERVRLHASLYGIDHWIRPLHAWLRAVWLANAVNAIVIRQLLVAVHGHALAVPAELAVGSWRDGTRRVATDSRALLEGEQLLSTEGLVVNLGGGLDQVLQVGARKEVTEIDEFAVVLILDCVTLVYVLE